MNLERRPLELFDSREQKISIEFTFEDVAELDTLIRSEVDFPEITEPLFDNSETLLTDISSVKNQFFVIGCRDSPQLILEKKTINYDKDNIKRKNLNSRFPSLNSSDSNFYTKKCGDSRTSSKFVNALEKEDTIKPSIHFGVSSKSRRKTKFETINGSELTKKDLLQKNKLISNLKVQKEEFLDSPNLCLNSRIDEKDQLEHDSSNNEKRLPIIEGYGPFSPRKSKQPPHIMLIVHGIGSNESAINKNREEFVHQLECVKAHWFWEVNIDITVDAVDWKSKLASVQDHMFDRITLPQHRENRMLLNKTIGDVMYFMVPRYGDYIVAEVAKQLNQKIKQYKSKITEEPKIVLIGHSLGSVIVYELVARQQTRITKSEIPKLEFDVDHLFLWGSPLPAMLVMMFPEYLRSGLTLPKGLAPIQSNEAFEGGNFILNKCPELKIYNVFHPYDPVAFRLEPLLYPNLNSLPEPVLLPYWRNLSKRTYHQWDKEMENARRALYEGISGITSSISNAVLGGILGWGGVSDEYKSTLEVNLVPRDQKIKQMRDESVISKFKTKFSAGRQMGTSMKNNPSNNEGQSTTQSHAEKKESDSLQFSLLKSQETPGIPARFDYQLQEGTTEHYISSLAFLQSHFNYWKSRDMGFFILWKIIEDFEPVICYDDYKTAIEQLKQDQIDLDHLNSSSGISDDSSYENYESE